MSVILRKRKNADGSTSLILDIYRNGERRYEFLKELKLCKASNPADRKSNKENLDLAEKIRLKRAQELEANDYSMITDTGKKTIVTEWLQQLVDHYTKKDKRNMQGALNRFKDFLIKDGKHGLNFGKLTEIIIADFQDYLRERSAGEGASSYFSRFKKMIKQAYRHRLIQTNTAADIKTVKGEAQKKDTLTLAEIQILANTHSESSEMKRAFLLSCLTGLRWIDVSSLKWENIDSKGRYLTIRQSKTGRPVRINLNEAAMKLLNKPKQKHELVFSLPTANGSNKSLKAL